MGPQAHFANRSKCGLSRIATRFVKSRGAFGRDVEEARLGISAGLAEEASGERLLAGRSHRVEGFAALPYGRDRKRAVVTHEQEGLPDPRREPGLDRCPVRIDDLGVTFWGNPRGDEREHRHYGARLSVSRTIVTGPVFTSSTSILAPKTPV